MVGYCGNKLVADDPGQRLVMLSTGIQDRPAVGPGHVGQPRDVVMAAKWQADTLKQAEQVEFTFRVHLVENLVGRKVVDADDHALTQVAKALWQALENLVRHGLHLGK